MAYNLNYSARIFEWSKGQVLCQWGMGSDPTSAIFLFCFIFFIGTENTKDGFFGNILKY